MGLIEKLERKRHELDQAVVRSINGSYDFRAAEMRDLLCEAIAKLRAVQMTEQAWLSMRQRYHEESFVE